MPSGRAWRQYLQLMSRAGVSSLPSVKLAEPTVRKTKSQPARTRQTPSAPVARPAGSALRSPAELQPGSVQVPPLSEDTSKILDGSLATAAEKSDALCRLADIVAGCNRCSELAETRTQTVFGVGNADARIMFVGEAPGADEDQQGEPFVGRAGQLLDKIIEASQLKRADLYICNILRCRPPGNRNPRPQEAGNCREFLDGQIRIVNPDYIVCWGTVAAQNLLSEKRTIGKLRGTFHTHNGARVLCTYHPSYLLRNPAAKKDVWDDMQILMQELGLSEPPS